MSHERAKAAAAFAAVFLLGALAGGFAGSAFESRRLLDAHEGGRHRVFLWSLSKRLDLRDEQRQKIEHILLSHDDESRAIHQGTEPQMRALRLKIRAEVRAVLDPAQQREFDAITQRNDQRRQAPPAGSP